MRPSVILLTAAAAVAAADTKPYRTELDFAQPKPAADVDRFIARLQRTLRVSWDFAPTGDGPRTREWACAPLFLTSCMKVDFWTRQRLVATRRSTIRYREAPAGAWRNPSATTALAARLRAATVRSAGCSPGWDRAAARVRFVRGMRILRLQRLAAFRSLSGRDGGGAATSVVVRVTRGSHAHAAAENATVALDAGFACPPRSLCRVAARTYYAVVEGVCEHTPWFDCREPRDACLDAAEPSSYAHRCGQMTQYAGRCADGVVGMRSACTVQMPLLAGWEEAPVTLYAYTVEPLEEG